MNDDISGFGPKMLALTEKQRGYVLAMLSDPLGNPTKWARAAGYSDSSEACKVKGHYLSHDDRIMEAAQEEAARHMNTIGPILGIGVMMQIARKSGHKKQLEAAAMLADRTGFHAKTEHRMTVEHTVDVKELEDLARRLALENGIAPERFIGLNAPGGGPVIEGEAVEEDRT